MTLNESITYRVMDRNTLWSRSTVPASFSLRSPVLSFPTTYNLAFCGVHLSLQPIPEEITEELCKSKGLFCLYLEERGLFLWIQEFSDHFLRSCHFLRCNNFLSCNNFTWVPTFNNLHPFVIIIPIIVIWSSPFLTPLLRLTPLQQLFSLLMVTNHAHGGYSMDGNELGTVHMVVGVSEFVLQVSFYIMLYFYRAVTCERASC